MSTNFSVDIPDDVEARFRGHFAADDPDTVMTALLKRTVFVRRSYESDEAMLSALHNGSIQFSSLRVR
ncbi:MAG: hypothetical protein Q7T86_11020 [Hyphomicrobiaceae bacterium]|nr:hypothetical protein [Hyphomicrobiaceae bacterium]